MSDKNCIEVAEFARRLRIAFAQEIDLKTAWEKNEIMATYNEVERDTLLGVIKELSHA